MAAPIIIETARLRIRPFVMDDLVGIHRILKQAFGPGEYVDGTATLQQRQSWLQWTILNEEWLANLHQPPYGDRAVTLKISGQLVGSIGYVPCLDAFEQLPELRTDSQLGYNTPEFGLFWAIDPQFQRQGYATEAARALIQYAFEHLRLKRIIATTQYSNAASRAVMRKLGMKLTENPLPEPRWLQVVGILENRNV